MYPVPMVGPSDIIDKYIDYVQDMLDVRLEGAENSSVHIWGRRANELAEKVGLPNPYDRADWSTSWMLLHAFDSDSEVEEKLRSCLDAAETSKSEYVEQRVAKVSTSSDTDREAKHSPDFRSVNWFGTEYHFTATQAACVSVLWDAWTNGTPEIGGDTLLVPIQA